MPVRYQPIDDHRRGRRTGAHVQGIIRCNVDDYQAPGPGGRKRRRDQAEREETGEYNSHHDKILPISNIKHVLERAFMRSLKATLTSCKPSAFRSKADSPVTSMNVL